MKAGKYILIGFCLILALFLGGISAGGGGADPREELIFSHQFHIEEAEATCQDCHSSAEQSSAPEDNLYPGQAVCAECHDVEDKAECTGCHANPDRIVPLEGFHPDYEVFAHNKHTAAGYDCSVCHAGVSKSTQWSVDEKLLPSMSDCIDCHSEEGQTLECGSCHFGKHPQPGDLSFMEWTRTHGLEAAFDPEHFQEYFELGYCEDCHQGLNLRGEVHQPGWLFVHGDEAAAGSDCFVCHEDRLECSNCHRRMLPVPHTLGDPAFANSQNGGEHKTEAEAYFEACLSCHDMGQASPTCSRCH